MAHISEDEALLRAFTEGLDVHRATASEVFGVALDQVSSEQRRYAKVINFGLIYGMSSFGLARNLGIETKAAAKSYIDRYFQRYPGVKNYMDETRLSAKSAASSRPCSAGACTCRRSTHPTARAAAAPSARPSTRPCRARRPT
jgi:DNA polymerase I-like protein with 3'-5' exonuclease and polymerase domains